MPALVIDEPQPIGPLATVQRRMRKANDGAQLSIPVLPRGLTTARNFAKAG
jgi:hypothetical protein